MKTAINTEAFASRELSDEELAQVSGGLMPVIIDELYVRVTVPDPVPHP